MSVSLNKTIAKAIGPWDEKPVRLTTAERMADETKRRLEVYDHTCSTFYMIVGSAYNCAQSAMADAVEELRKTKYFRHKMKQDANAAMRCYEDFNRRMRLQLGDRYTLWLDVTDAIYEEMQPHIRNLFFSCEAALMKNGIAGHRLRALMLTASTMIDVARHTFEDVMNTSRKEIGVDLSPLFAGGTFKDVERHWHDCMKPMLDTPGHEDLDLQNERNCRLAVDVILARMADMDMYERAGAYGVQYNAEVVEKYEALARGKKQQTV